MATPTYNRHVRDDASTRSLDAEVKAEELAIHTIKICTNQNIFIPEYRSALTEDLISTAKDIYCCVNEANNIKVDEDKLKWQRRSELQEIAASKCNRMLSLISLSKKLFHLRGKKVRYWIEKTVDSRNYIRRWHESDVQRYGNL